VLSKVSYFVCTSLLVEFLDLWFVVLISSDRAQCPGGAIKDACKDQHCNGEDWLEDELEETMSE